MVGRILVFRLSVGLLRYTCILTARFDAVIPVLDSMDFGSRVPKCGVYDSSDVENIWNQASFLGRLM